MSKVQWQDYMRQGHGTEARARRHYRAGEKPLRRYCPRCADAGILAKALRREKPQAPVEAGRTVIESDSRLRETASWRGLS